MNKAGNRHLPYQVSLPPFFIAVSMLALGCAPVFTAQSWAQFQLNPGTAAPPAPIVEAPMLETPILETPVDAGPTSWLTYKSDLQRTGATKARLGSALNLLWRHSTDIEGKAYDTSPLVVGPPGQRRVYMALDHTIFGIDGQTGAQIWRSEPLTRPIVSPIILLPGETGDLILSVTSSGQLNALRASDGTRAWKIGAAAPVQNMAPVIIKTAAGERIMVALATGRLIAFTLDGELDTAWDVRLGSFSSSPTATPSVSSDGRLLYIPTQDKKLFVIDILNAKVAYSVALRNGAYASPLVFEDRVLLVTDTSLTSMKQRTGQTGWIFDVKSALGAPAAARGAKGAAIYVGARNGKFYAVNSTTGAKLWETDLAESVTGAPTVAADMVLVGTRNGVLFGLSREDGRVLWRYRLRTERVVAPEQDDNVTGGNTSDPLIRTRPAGNGNADRNADENTDRNALPEAPPSSNGPIWETATMQTFGMTSQPVIVEGMAYVLGDNAALYAFSAQPFDAEPPMISSARLSIPNSASRPSLQRLDLEKPLLVPGQAPIQLAVEIIDEGSGLNPDSIVVRFQNADLPKSALGTFSDATGKLLVTLAEQKGRTLVNLADGLYPVTITAKDYRGNEMSYTVNFAVDNSISPPPAPVVEDRDETRIN